MSNHLRPDHLYPSIIRSELLRLAGRRRDWVGWTDMGGDSYHVRVNERTWLEGVIQSTGANRGHEYLGLLAASLWMADGPKVFRMTADQEAALANVSVNIRGQDFRQPFQSILVDVKTVQPFRSVLVHNADRAIVLIINSNDRNDDITTVIKRTDRPIEDSLVKYDDSCADVKDQAHVAARIAINACLALTHFGCRLDQWLFAAERQQDLRLTVKKSGDVADRARERIAMSPRLITFDREVRLYRTEDVTTSDRGVGDGHEKSTHWRRGHWAMVRCGVGGAERRPAFREAVLVRADRMDPTERARITTAYRS